MPCTPANVKNILDNLATQMTQGDLLYVYVTTHADIDNTYNPPKYYFDLMGGLNSKLYNDEFADKLNLVQCSQMIIDIWSCLSGGFVPALNAMSNPAKKTILTVTNSFNPATTGGTIPAATCMFSYNYANITAFRGWHPDVLNPAHRAPWAVTYVIGTLPQFQSLYGQSELNYDDPNNGGNGNGIQDINEVINYTKYDGQFPDQGTKLYEDGFIVHASLYDPVEDLLSLKGITGKVIYSQVITGSQNAPNHFLIGDNLSIEPGIELTLSQNTTFHIWNSKLIVKPGIEQPLVNGGKLIIDGATLTSSDNSWKGIEVWGDKSKSQYEDPLSGYCAQGTLIFKNNAHVYNASDIILSNPNDNNLTGGIIRATDSWFYNNKTSSDFRSYHNFIPGNPLTPHTGNLSYFSRCHFEVDNSYNQTDPFTSHIIMSDVEGIRITGCNFINSNNTLTGSDRGVGLNTIDAGFWVGPDCSSKALPCPSSDVIPTIFQSLYTGINASSSASTNTFGVNKSQFIDNGYGIWLRNINNAAITQDTFDIGPNISCPTFTGGIGIQLESCDGYKIEENNFKHTGNSPQGVQFIGILNKGFISPGYVLHDNEIYLNIFHDINVGNQANNSNANENGDAGLCYICNKNYNNQQYDFNVSDHGIKQNQGSQNNPAGNRFSKMGTTESDFKNTSQLAISYYYHDNQNLLNDQRPDYYTPNKLFPYGTLQQPYCGSHLGGSGNGTEHLTGGQIDSLQQSFAYYSDAYNNTLNLFESLKDGGNTSGLDADISSSTSDGTMALRDELLGYSPHLSKEILQAAAAKTDVLPDPILFEILAANPDELRNGELLTYLTNKTNPLPDYMIEMLSEIAADTTYKTTLESELSRYEAERTRAAHSLI